MLFAGNSLGKLLSKASKHLQAAAAATRRGSKEEGQVWGSLELVVKHYGSRPNKLTILYKSLCIVP